MFLITKVRSQILYRIHTFSRPFKREDRAFALDFYGLGIAYDRCDAVAVFDAQIKRFLLLLHLWAFV